jgi:hypothetical protein
LHNSCRKLSARLGGKRALQFYEDSKWQNHYNFAYINSKKFFIINKVDFLFDGQLTTMFCQNQVFSIHPQNTPCGKPPSTSQFSTLANSVQNFLHTHYPKQKFLNILFTPLIEKDLINSNLYFKAFNKIHIIDFISWINNRFEKKDKPPGPLKNLIKHLQSENVHFPSVCLKNPLAKKLFS